MVAGLLATCAVPPFGVALRLAVDAFGAGDPPAAAAAMAGVTGATGSEGGAVDKATLSTGGGGASGAAADALETNTARGAAVWRTR